MLGDRVLGSDAFRYRQKAGDEPLPADRLRDLHMRVHQEYVPPETIFDLFLPEAATEARHSLDEILYSMFLPLTALVPYYALLRADFEQRQHRHTAMVAQCIERDRRVLTPFLDPSVIDFSLRVPLGLFHDKHLYKHMLKRHFPALAAIPYAASGLPISSATIRSALKWRLEKFFKHFPKMRRRLNRRNAMFRFADGVVRQGTFFFQNEHSLHELAPPLQLERTLNYYRALVSGGQSPAGQVCALLPSALFVGELRQRRGTTDPCETSELDR